MRKINPELWLLFFLVVIAAMLNFLVASQRMVLVFFFLPTLFSAYHLGRRHATLTAFASVVLVAAMAFLNPAMFSHRIELPFAKWLDLGLWGGVLILAGYTTGTLHQKNQKSLHDMQEGYDGMLAILQNFLASQKYSDSHAFRISLSATRIAEGVGLDAGSVEDVRTAALLFNMKDLGVTNEVLCKAAQVSEEELRQGKHKRSSSQADSIGSSLRRSIPIFLEERQLRQAGAKPEDTPFEVQVLSLAEEYESLITGQAASKMSPSQAAQEVIRRAQGRYDSLIVNAFTNTFGGQAATAKA